MAARARVKASVVTIAMVLAALPAAPAQGAGQKVRATRANETMATGADGVLAWSQSKGTRGYKSSLFVKREGRSRIKVNPKGTGASPGSIHNGVLIYQQRGRRSSQLKLYNLATGKRSPAPRKVNGSAWEFLPTMSDRFILFGRGDRRGTKVMLYRRASKRLVTLDKGARRTYLQPGQVNGNFATWIKWKPGERSKVYRRNLATGKTTRISTSRNFDWAPSVSKGGAVFFGRTGSRCGLNTRLMRWRNGSTAVLARFRRGIDIWHSNVFTDSRGKVTVLHNRTDCNDGGRGDLWRIVDPSTKTLSVRVQGTLGGTVTSRPRGISCEGDCVQDFEPGTRVTLRAEPSSPASTFEGWSVASCEGTGPCTVRMTKNRTVTARFSP